MPVDNTRAYFELEQQLIALQSSDLPPRERLEQKMENYKQRMALLPKVSFQNGMPHAQVLENRYPWDTSAPLPHVISDSNNTYLAYILSDRAQALEEEPVTALAQNEGSYHCALLHFQCCIDYRFGGANDEVLGSHPLEGLDYYALHQVHSSPWLAELRKTNAHHSGYDPKWWEDFMHYFFTFHDETFECIAKGFTAELYQGYIRDVMKLAFDRIFK